MILFIHTAHVEDSLKVLIISEIIEDIKLLTQAIQVSSPELKVIHVTDEKSAINILSSDGPFLFFIIDVQIKTEDPDKITKNLLDLCGQRPVAFFGEDSEIDQKISKATFEANSNNCKIHRPLNSQNFKQQLDQAVKNAMSWAQKEDFGSDLQDFNPDDFVPMKIKSFYLYKTFPYDIYLQLTPTKYMKIISAHRPYTISKLTEYAKKNIRHLYIAKDDQIKYLEEQSALCIDELKQHDHESEKFFIVLLRSFTIHHQYLLTLGVTDSVVKLSNAICETLFKMGEQPQCLRKILQDYPYKYEGVASKSLLTALISFHIGKKMGWESVTTMNKLTMASILQDYMLPDEALSKINHHLDERLENFPAQAVLAFHEHPKKVAQIAQQFITFPDVDSLIKNHHELPNRKGFPNQPVPSKLTHLNGVFNIAQHFSAQIDGYQYSKSHNAKIIKMMNKDFNLGVFKEPFKEFKAALGIK